MKSRLSDVPAAIRLSRATLRNIHENLFWAFIHKKALEALDGVKKAEVSHKTGTAVVTLEKEISDDVLKKAVADQGYQVTDIQLSTHTA